MTSRFITLSGIMVCDLGEARVLPKREHVDGESRIFVRARDKLFAGGTYEVAKASNPFSVF